MEKKGLRCTFALFIGTLFWLLPLKFSYGQTASNFIHLEKSFSSNSLIETDPYGYIWITDSDGLNKYDGYDFQNIPLSNFFGESFINRSKVKFNIDSRGSLWIGTLGGELAKVSSSGDVKVFSDFLTSFNSPNITAIATKGDRVAIATNSGYIFAYDYKTDELKQIAVLPQYNEAYKSIHLLDFSDENQLWISTRSSKIFGYSFTSDELLELQTPLNQSLVDLPLLTHDQKGNLWISSENQGFFKYNIASQEFKHFDYKVNNGLQYPMFRSIYADMSGKIWLGSDGDGLYLFNPENETFTNFSHSINNQFSLATNTVLEIKEDMYGNIWTVQKWGLIDILPNYRKSLEYYIGSDDETPTAVISVLKAKDGTLYFGNDGNGMTKVSPKGESISYDFEKKPPYFFQGRYAQTMIEDVDSNIWIGTYQNGLFIYNPKNNQFTKKEISDNQGLATYDVRKLYRDKQNRIWAASNLGIHVFSPNGEKMAFFAFSGPSGLVGSISDYIAESPNGEIWVATYHGGLFKFHENKDDLTQSTFQLIPYFDQTEDDNYDYSISSFSTVGDNIWIRTLSGFIIKLDTKNLTFQSYANHKSLKNLIISEVKVDQETGLLWLSTLDGIYSFDPIKENLTAFDQSDGVRQMRYPRRSIYVDESGKFYFMGSLGVTAFYPSSLQKSENQAQLFIKRVEVLNKPAQSIIPEQLKDGLENFNKLDLKANQSSFSFEFSAIGNTLNSDFRYEYRLVGFNDEWITPTSSHQAIYTNIPAGNYTFEVRAGSKAGVWNIPVKQVEVSIAPYWWKSNLAYAFYFLLFILSIIGLYYWINFKNKIIREELVYNQEKELYALKMNFFAKMSHEIQTPLTLILAPLKDMVNRATQNGNKLLEQRLKIIQNNAERLSRISNDLMTVRDKELKKLKLQVEKKDIFQELKKIGFSFTDQAEFKDIQFHLEIPDQEVIVWYDYKKIEHIFYNLLSNAFKFTKRGGEISFLAEFSPKEDLLKISVSDSGVGISENDKSQIFEIYYQTASGKSKNGMGIGLALTKELVELHHGTISLESEENVGTTFVVTIPTNESAYSQDEKMVEADIVPADNLEIQEPDPGFSEKKHTKKAKEDLPKILIVEDNVEMQIFLQEYFQDQYQIALADNGKVALEIVNDFMPEIIISDLMMPIMNGIEMSKVLIKNNLTSHIPIILLTAKNNTESRMLGLSSGAIYYIQKPFNPLELSIRVANLLEHKRKTFARVKTSVVTEPEMDKMKSKNDIFIDKLVSELNDQIENTNFKLEDLTQTMHMSYSVIFRKCQEITGKNLLEFYRILKLKRAASLIIKNGYRISEAAYMVGYNDSKYFSKCFKEEFGKTPAQFKREAKSGDPEKILEELTKL
ncbi:hybrid sensor histidine kinase/response regulator transcription factor [Algoriphagus machipongonensis]|uniref:hybrid sensor histidine kinase/response regulator transcription factor n=1 Tax=Algoriphagus machipongonensis TaxID=388413 RepID=UPI0002DD7215|nr:ATP-binding protein [Algoriphagus machipongonensis]